VIISWFSLTNETRSRSAPTYLKGKLPAYLHDISPLGNTGDGLKAGQRCPIKTSAGDDCMFFSTMAGHG